jgi:ATP-dependent Lon protease
MRNSDWFLRDEEDEFGETLHRRTEELYSVQDTLADEGGFVECPAIALRDVVIFPRMVSPIFVGREGSLLAIEETQLEDQTMIALLQSDPDQDNPSPEDFYPIGVEIAVGRLLSMPDGSNSALVHAGWRSSSSPRSNLFWSLGQDE